MSREEREEDELDATRAPLLEHLIELRRRLIWSFVALVIAFAVCFNFANEIYDFLAAPLHDLFEKKGGGRMIATQLQEPFFTYIKVSLFAGLMISFPIIAGQLWAFVAPGLYKNEKTAFLPFLIATPILFIAGAAMAYYVVFPLAWGFFLSFETEGSASALAIEFEPRVADYLSLVMKLIFAFGVSFLLPVALTLMGRVGLVTSDGLKKGRKYAIVIAFAVAALLTPPDIISQILLGVPILLLYEISILAIRMTEKKRARRNDENADE